MATLSKKEALLVDITMYNSSMEIEWKKMKVKCSLCGDLRVCKHCGRKYSICCICDASCDRWDAMIQEVKNVSVMKKQVLTLIYDSANDKVSFFDLWDRLWDFRFKHGEPPEKIIISFETLDILRTKENYLLKMYSVNKAIIRGLPAVENMFVYGVRIELVSSKEV